MMSTTGSAVSRSTYSKKLKSTRPKCDTFPCPSVRCAVKLFALLVASFLLICPLLAQESDDLQRGPDGDTRTHITGIVILPVAGKPFSGRDSIDWTHTIENGTVIAMHQDAWLARDSDGRIYRENVTRFPANSDGHSERRQFMIFDPVEHTATRCEVSTRRCLVSPYRAPTSFRQRPAGPFDNGNRTLSRESLGANVLNGLNVNGTREAVTINPGVVGNSQPLSITKEFWYSPDLEVNLSVTRQDPREGTITIHVVDLSRDPDPSMFKVPIGFVVQKAVPAKAEN